MRCFRRAAPDSRLSTSPTTTCGRSAAGVFVGQRAGPGQLYSADLAVRLTTANRGGRLWGEPACFESALVNVDFGGEEDALAAKVLVLAGVAWVPAVAG